MDTPRLGSFWRTSSPVAARLASALALGLVARVSLSLATPFREDDGTVFGSWAQTLRDQPLGRFYATAWRPDHLPGDLWFLKVLQTAYTSAGGTDFRSPTFEFLLKAVPITADVVIGVLVFHLVKIWASEESAARAARWYLLNPAVIVLSSVWGQWDALSAAFLLAGFLIVARGGRSWVWAAPWLVWAVLIKPPLALGVAVVLAWLVVMHGWRLHRLTSPKLRVHPDLLFTGLGVGTAVVLLAPFRVGVAWAPAGGSSLLERVHYAAAVYPATTMGAANVWMVVDRRLKGRPDDVARWGSVTPATVAVILFVLALGAIALTAWRAFPRGQQAEAMLWSAAAATFGSCLLLTRAHERYYFPALVFLLLWASIRGLDAISRAFFWTFSLLFILDLAFPTAWSADPGGLVHRPEISMLLGSFHLAFFLALLATPWRARSRREVTARGEIRAGAPSAASGARRTAPG